MEALGLRSSEEPAVLVRLLLMSVDQASGEQHLVSSFLRKISMPLALARPGVKIALELNRERRVFDAADVIWDETDRVCIVEVVWVVADDRSMVDTQKADRRRVDAKRAPRTRSSASATSDRSPGA
jgi:hypothetical protein